MFDFGDIAVPILVAPMAGGPSTPELAAAGTTAGGLGFVAAGYLTPEMFSERLTAARALTSGPIGANLFVPQPSAGTPADIERYARALRPEAEHYGAQLGEPRFDDDHWAAKIAVLLDTHASAGLDAMAQVDLGRRTHRHQSQQALGVMAAQVLGTAARRLGIEPVGELVRQFGVEDHAPIETPLDLTERPPVASLGA